MLSDIFSKRSLGLLAFFFGFAMIGASAQTSETRQLLKALGLDPISQPAAPLVKYEGIFFDRALSADGMHACSDCHKPHEAWSSVQSNKPITRTPFKAVPTLYGAASRYYFFWDGRAASLESQIMEVLENPNEMNGSRLLTARFTLENSKHLTACRPNGATAVYLTIKTQDQLASLQARALYDSLPPDQRTEIDRSFACVAHEIAIYIRNLPTPQITWLSTGSGNDLTQKNIAAYRGALIFAGKGRCAICHYGPNFTDGQFHNIGIADESQVDISDPGRYQAAKYMSKNPYNILASQFYPETLADSDFSISEEMWGAFKTPSLIELRKRHTFMHNGKFKTIEQVVDYYDTLADAVISPHHYVALLRPMHLSPQERSDLIAFLYSL